jgi:hypothetical protein
MAFSLRELLRSLAGGKKERSPFESEAEAYQFCLELYRKNGGVTPELRRAYEFYLRNSYDGCDKYVGPPARSNHPSPE